MKFTTNSDFNELLYAISLQGRFFNTESSRRIRAASSPEERKDTIKRLIKGVNHEFREQAHREVSEALEADVQLIGLADESYPSVLREINDPPLVLFVHGRLPTEDEMRFAIVGTRQCTDYGARAARTLARRLSQHGVCVVSGLAHGIDAEAHAGAIDGRGAGMGNYHPGIAVLGSGLGSLYPAANRGLAARLLNSGGALISEYGIEQRPRRDLFPRRNRIISGLSRGVLVIEAAKKSGSLITARLALEQNRDVFALPGQIDSEVSCGTNQLLKQGAYLLDSFDELLALYPELTEKNSKATATREKKPTARAQRAQTPSDRILKAFSKKPRANIDELCAIAELNTRELLPLLSRLELEGKLELGADRRYVLTSLIDS